MAVDRRKCCQLNAAVASLSHFVYNLLSATQRGAVRRYAQTPLLRFVVVNLLWCGLVIGPLGM